MGLRIMNSKGMLDSTLGKKPAGSKKEGEKKWAQGGAGGADEEREDEEARGNFYR